MQACNETKQLANIVGDVKEVQVLSYSWETYNLGRNLKSP